MATPTPTPGVDLASQCELLLYAASAEEGCEDFKKMPKVRHCCVSQFRITNSVLAHHATWYR